MSADMEQIAVLAGFVLLMLFLNLKAGGSHWSSAFLEWASFLLLIAGSALLVAKVWEFVR